MKDRQLNCQKKIKQKDQQRSTKHTQKTKDRVTRTPLKTGVNSDALKWYAAPAPVVAPAELI